MYTNNELLELNDENLLNHVLKLEDDEKQEIIELLKVKNKPKYFYITGKLKSIKSNIKVRDINSINNADKEDEVDLSLLEDNPYQPRIDIDEFKVIELAASIAKDGLLQPIVVNKSGPKEFQIIGGHTRRDALLYNKLKKGKIFIFSNLSKDHVDYKKCMLSNGLIENLQRNDLDPLETALSFSRALEEGVYESQNDIAFAIGKTKNYVSKIMSILRLCEFIKKDLRINKSIRDLNSLYFLQRITDYTKQVELYNKLVAREISREDIVSYVKNMNNKTESEEVKKIKVEKNRIVIKSDFSNLDNDRKKDLEKEIERIIKKYSK